ncbi:MAG: surface lipoprotein assembly modifier [Pseudomonadota bacterium]
MSGFLLGAVTTGAHAQELRLSPAQAFAFANQLIAQNKPRAAAAIAQGLLQSRPEAPDLWLLLGQAARATGESSASREAARKALAFAQTPLQRHNAAVLVADSYVVENRLTLAQVWLRRARQNAPNDALKARLARDYKILDRQNPWKYNFDFSVRPSSNINNGSSEATLNGENPLGSEPVVLSVDSQALSGFQARGFGAVSYTKALKDGASWSLLGRADLRRYWFSQDAKDKLEAARAADPTADLPGASDFSFDDLGLRGTYRFAQNARGLGREVGLELGRNWYGGEPLSRSAMAFGSLTWTPTPRSLGQVSLSYGRQERSDADSRSATLWTLGYTAVFIPQNGGRLQFGVSISDTNARSATVAHSRYSTTVSYTLAKPVAGVELTTRAGFSRRLDDAAYFGLVNPALRKDTRYTLGITAFFPNRDLYGFAPTLNLDWSQTNSTVSRFKSEEFAVTVGLRSVF